MSKTGTTFGGTALVGEKSKFANERILCKLDCHFALLSKREYARILYFSKKERIENQAHFLSKLQIFQKCSFDALLNWIPAFDLKKIYRRKHVLYRQGDKPEFIYIIKSGNVLCNRVVNMQPEVVGPHQVGVDEQNQVFLIEKERFRKNMEIAIFGPNQIFGEEEALDAFILTKEKELLEKYDYKKQKKAFNRNKKGEDEGRKLEVGELKRKTTMIVASHSAEVWSVPIMVRVFLLLGIFLLM